MTGLMPASSVYPPVWQYDVSPAAASPCWEPPTTPAHRRRKQQRLGLAGLVHNLLGWLGPSRPPDELDALPSPAQGLDAAAPHRADPPPPPSPPGLPEPVMLEFARLRGAICALPTADRDSLQPLLADCVGALSDDLHEGRLPASPLDPAVLDPLDPLDPVAGQRIPARDVADQLLASYRGTILSALARLEARGDGVVDAALWRGLARRVLASRARPHDLALFAELMRHMPPRLREQIPANDIAELAQALLDQQASRPEVTGGCSLEAHRLSEGLLHLSATQRQDVDEGMRRFLLRQRRAVREAQSLSFPWLLVKAYDALSPAPDLLSNHRALSSPTSRLDSLHLWHLAVARLTATGDVGAELHARLLGAPFESLSERWTFLVLALKAAPDADEVLRRLCALLDGLGGFDAMAQALTQRPPPLVRVDAVQAVAAACGDHARALALHDALVGRGVSERALASWTWTLWVPYVEGFIKDPSMDTWRVWEVLGVATRADKWPQRAGDAGDAEPADAVEAKVRLLDHMAGWFLQATHLNDRQQLRELENVIYVQRGLTGKTTDRVLVLLADLLTRDFPRGFRGRAARFEWLVHLVHETKGEDEAATVAAAIKGWDWTFNLKYHTRCR